MASERDAQVRPPSWWSHAPLRNALVAGAIALTGFLLSKAGVASDASERVFYWIAIPVGAASWAPEAVEKLLGRVVGIEMLMLAATAGCGALGLWDEAAALVVLYGAAEGVEGLTFARTRHAIRALLDLAPRQARVLREGVEVLVAAEDLRPGDRIVVRPGEALATDGVIVEGRSGLDESAITGESVPVEKEPGDRVLAASLNGQGLLTVEVTAAFSDSSLARVIHLVEEAQEQKGRAEQWIDRFGRLYSPAVLLTSALLFFAPRLMDVPADDWSRRAVVLLVAAAPCALVISLPVAAAAGIARAGRRGILIKGGVHLEHLAAARVVAFDKTGTLTVGRPAVTDVVPPEASEELLTVAAGLERGSEHPLARGITAAAEERGLQPARVTGFEALPGAGVRGRIGDAVWHIGRPDLFRSAGSDGGDLHVRLRILEREGKTVVLLGDQERVRGMIALQDRPRPGAARVVERLHEGGYQTVMLTGDNGRTARQVAGRLGVASVRAELSPEDKVEAVRELQRAGPVLMVGDGVNDAPALAAATCGVAMGAAGTDAAIEAADVALMSDRLESLPEALRLGRHVRRIGRQNVVFSLLVLAVLVPLGVSGMISVAAAVLAHEASELLAVANGLRAGTRRPERAN